MRTEDFEVSHRVSSPAPYRDYRLCARAENDYGASEWTFIGPSVLTLPAAPSAPSFELGESEIETESYGGQEVTRLVWSVAGSDGIPQDSDQYKVKVFRSNERSIPRGQTQNACEDPTATDFGGVVIGGTPTKATTNDGIEIEVLGADLVTKALTPDEYYIYACVRADPDEIPDNGDHGAWSVSSPQKFVAGQDGLVGGDVLNLQASMQENSGTANVKATWTWAEQSDADGYQVQYAEGRSDVRNHDPDPTVSKDKTEYSLTKSAGTTVALRVRYNRTISGTRLYSPWSHTVSVLLARITQ